jgi:hypothetical protein
MVVDVDVEYVEDEASGVGSPSPMSYPPSPPPNVGSSANGDVGDLLVTPCDYDRSNATPSPCGDGVDVDAVNSSPSSRPSEMTIDDMINEDVTTIDVLSTDAAEEEEAAVAKENLVVSQMVTEDDSEGGGGGRNNTALIVSATSGAVSVVIAFALGMYFLARRKRGVDANAAEETTQRHRTTMPETKSDVFIGNSTIAAMETGTKRDVASSSNDDDYHDEEGYFGSIRVREWIMPEATDLSTLGADETLGYEVDNFDDTAGGMRCAFSSISSPNCLSDDSTSHVIAHRIPNAFPLRQLLI